MWIRWILQNQWPWLLLCPVGFSAKPQGGADVQAVPHYPTPFPWECCSVWGMGTAGASRYFSWGIAGSLQLPSGGFLTPWSSWKELEPFPGCSNRFSCCSIPPRPGAVPVPLLPLSGRARFLLEPLSSPVPGSIPEPSPGLQQHPVPQAWTHRCHGKGGSSSTHPAPHSLTALPSPSCSSTAASAPQDPPKMGCNCSEFLCAPAGPCQ